MKEQPRWRRYMRIWGADVRSDVEDELGYHLDQLAAEYRAAGASPEEAERRARQRFGEYKEYERTCVTIGEETAMMQRRRNALDTLWQDVRYALRQLRAQRLATLTMLLTIALGIGANTAIFSVVNAVLLRPLPYKDIERLVTTQLSVPEYRELRARQLSYESMTVWASNRYNIPGDAPEEVLGAIVEPEFFALLMQPALGHGIGADEVHTPVAVISDGLWRRRFNASADVLGQSLTLSAKTYTIIGVMPRSFQYPNAEFEVWVPFEDAMSGTALQLQNRSLRIFRVLGRLRPDVTAARANEELASISEEWQRDHPQTNSGIVFTVTSVPELLLGAIRPRLAILLVAVSFVLLIACANVANLMLGAMTRRAREMAVRRAIGAPRARLLRQLLTETLVLALLGGAAGVALAALSLRLLPLVPGDVPRINEVTLDARVLLFALTFSALTALLAGIAPAVKGSGADLREALQEGGRGGVGTRGGGRLRALLVAGEVAVSVVVLVGAGLLVHSLVRVLDQDIGIRYDDLVHANTGLFYFDGGPERVAKLEQALERVAALDGVSAVAASSGLPPQTAQRVTGFAVIGHDADEAERSGALWMGVTADYFRTIGGRVIHGREFDLRDRAGGMPVALINQTLARSLFGDGNALGNQIRLTNAEAGDELRTIVGVVNDIRYQGVELNAAPAIYTPFAQRPFMWAYVMVRTSVPAARLTRAMREAIATVDPRMAPSSVVQHRDLIATQLAQRRFITALLGGFALLALVLAAIGIYGVTATAVAQRRREIGVRMALGAQPRAILTQVVGGAVLLVATGLAVGLLAALWLSRLLTAMLYEVDARDPATFALGGVLMLLTAVIASAWPAWRAARVDPMSVVRS